MQDRPSTHHFSAQSLFGLNAINFFQAEMVGVIMRPLQADWARSSCRRRQES
jgi:hypothetical protein